MKRTRQARSGPVELFCQERATRLGAQNMSQTEFIHSANSLQRNRFDVGPTSPGARLVQETDNNGNESSGQLPMQTTDNSTLKNGWT